jgi:hypothetical protein
MTDSQMAAARVRAAVAAASASGAGLEKARQEKVKQEWILELIRCSELLCEGEGTRRGSETAIAEARVVSLAPFRRHHSRWSRSCTARGRCAAWEYALRLGLELPSVPKQSPSIRRNP